MLKLILSTTIGSVLTYFLNFNLGFGPFIASALVGLVAIKLFSKFAAPIYAASFVSMSSLEVLPHITLSLFSGLFTGLIYLSVQKIFIGVGGKLGVIAFFSVLIVSGSRLVVYSYNPLTLFEILYLIFTSCFGAGLTYYISIRFRQNPVFSSSVVVLTFALIENIFLKSNNEIVTAVTCGSYAGMSSCEVIMNIKKMCLVGLVTGIILFLSWPLFCGVGGRLGLVAFLAVFLSKLVKEVTIFISQSRI